MNLRRALRAGIGVVLAAAATVSGGTSWAEEAVALQTYQMVRSLELVQDRIAAGDQAAVPMQRKLLEMIDQSLRASSVEQLSQPVNFRALLIYAMSGGNPETLEQLISKLKLSEADSRKGIGILSYLHGGSKAAIVSLKTVDPMAEPQELGAFLALIKGSVVGLEDPKAALKLLDKARLLAPGTLVEEAALRRSMPFRANAGDAAGFLRTCEQYVSAYIRSPYASQFADAFVDGIVTLHASLDRAALAGVISGMSPEQQRVIYLRIARRSAIAGLADFSTFASDAAAAIELPSATTTDPRALLYASLAGVATQPMDKLKSTISRIDRAKLSSGDQELLDAVQTLSAAIVSEPEAPRDAPDPAPRVIEAPKADVGDKSAAAASQIDVANIPVEAAPGQPASTSVAKGEQANAAEVTAAFQDAGAKPLTRESAPDASALAGAKPPAVAPELPASKAPQKDAGNAPMTEAPGAPAATATAPAAAKPADAGPVVASADPQSVDLSDPNDPADQTVATARKKLQEIDALLAKATK